MAEHTIDIEPTWETLCNLAHGGALDAKELMPACKVADMVRQAQKKGKKGITFTFTKEGKTNVEEVD